MEKILGNLTSLGKAGKALLLINYFISFKAKDFRRIKKSSLFCLSQLHALRPNHSTCDSRTDGWCLVS